MTKRIFLLAPVYLLGILVIGTRAVVAGPRFYFEPASGNYNQGSDFSVTVKIDTGQKEAMAGDAVINFDSSRLTVVQVTNGGFFSGFDYDVESGSGRLTIYAFSEQALQTKSGTGDLAVITFKVASGGTASVSFLCQAGNDTDSAIWDAQGNDLIDCAANGSGSYSLGQADSDSGEDTSTEGNTSTGGDTSTGDTSGDTSPGGDTSMTTHSAPEAPTPTPSQLLATGIETPLLILGISGGIILLLSLVIAL